MKEILETLITASVFYWAVYLYFQCRKLKRDVEIEKIKRRLERNMAVYWYRSFVSKTDKQKYSELPDYDDMLSETYNFPEP